MGSDSARRSFSFAPSMCHAFPVVFAFLTIKSRITFTNGTCPRSRLCPRFSEVESAFRSGCHEIHPTVG